MTSEKMNAVGYYLNQKINHMDSLVDLVIDKPILNLPNDILVHVKAISVNPVDYKIRQGVPASDGNPKILGWDVAGVVVQVGTAVANFKVGDEVYYAGELTRNGGNAEFHLVDSRIVGIKPQSIDFEKAAALPLTTITAWELIFDRLKIVNNQSDSTVLIVGGAGGVGSIAIQLIKKLTNLKVIATSSRADTEAWVRKLGADSTINHHKPLIPQIKELNMPAIRYIISTTSSEHYAHQFAEIIEPQGQIALIDDPNVFDIVPFKRKSVSIHWELMFTRSLYQTSDLASQGHLLNEVSKLVDQKLLTSTKQQSLGKMNAKNLKKAHELLESGSAIGKITLLL